MSECAWVQLARVCQSVPSPSFPIIINDCLNGIIATPQVTTRSECVCAWRSSKGARKRAKLNHWQPPFIRPSPTASGLTPMAYARSSPNILIYTPTSNFARPPTHQMMGYAVPPPPIDASKKRRHWHGVLTPTNQTRGRARGGCLSEERSGMGGASRARSAALSFSNPV